MSSHSANMTLYGTDPLAAAYVAKNTCLVKRQLAPCACTHFACGMYQSMPTVLFPSRDASVATSKTGRLA